VSAAVFKLLALIPIGIAVAVWAAVMRAGDRLPIWSCPALRNVCHDAADDLTPYALIAFFASNAIAAVALFIMG
jgi:hypothetical protein